MIYHQQGDCCFTPVSEIPSNAVLKKDKVILRGSTKDHWVVGNVEVFANPENSFVKTNNENFKVNHATHEAQNIPPSPTGYYRIDVPKELDPFKKVVEATKD